MNKRGMLAGAAAAAGMLVLILDGKTALMGARDGVELCLRTVIPSLFPFFMLSGILVGNLMGCSLSLLRPVGRLLGIPRGSEALLIGGFLGGYPVGAKCIRDSWTQGCLSKKDAERLLCFCNNAGPSFLFGIAAPLFSNPVTGWMLWGIHIASALLTGILIGRNSPQQTSIPSGKAPDLMDTLHNTVKVTAQVCGWVLLFRILTVFLERWFLWRLPGWASVAVTGLLELSNGCVALSGIESESLRFVLCSTMLSAGGLCVYMQTASAAKGLCMKGYCLGKGMQTVFSLLFSGIYLGMLSPLWLLGIPMLTVVRKTRKNSSFPQPFGV